MQFLGRDDLMYEGVPTLGFYKSFLPLVQGYGWPRRPFWLAKAFMPSSAGRSSILDSKEENGVWDEIERRRTAETVLNGYSLCMANHRTMGLELRTGKVIRKRDDNNGLCCYAKLSYSTKYPWEASLERTPESQMYVVHDTAFDFDRQSNALL